MIPFYSAATAAAAAHREYCSILFGCHVFGLVHLFLGYTVYSSGRILVGNGIKVTRTEPKPIRRQHYGPRSGHISQTESQCSDAFGSGHFGEGDDKFYAGLQGCTTSWVFQLNATSQNCAKVSQPRNIWGPECSKIRGWRDFEFMLGPNARARYVVVTVHRGMGKEVRWASALKVGGQSRWE